MFNDEESADIMFQVSQQLKINAAKVGQRLHQSSFMLNCLIVRACSDVLADLCQSKGDPTTPTDISPDVFWHLLYYIYGGKIDNDYDMKYEGTLQMKLLTLQIDMELPH